MRQKSKKFKKAKSKIIIAVVVFIALIISGVLLYPTILKFFNASGFTISTDIVNGVQWYYAKNQNGVITYSSPSAPDVVNPAISYTSSHSGGEIQFKPGTYETGSIGFIMKNNVNLIAENTGSPGSSVTGVTLKQTGNVNVLSYITSSAGSEGNIKIEGFTFEGNRIYTGNAIKFVNVSIASLSTLRIYNFNGAAIYASNLFSSSVTDVIADNCGNPQTQTATLFFDSDDTGEYKTGCANLQLNDLQVSTNNYRALDIYGADITVNHIISDAQATPQASMYGAIKILARSRAIDMNDIFVRNSAAGTNAIENQADSSKWNGVTVEYALGTCFANAAYGSSAQLSNVVFSGVNSTMIGNVGFDVQAGFVQVNNYHSYYLLTANQTGPTGIYQVTNWINGVP